MNNTLWDGKTLRFSPTHGRKADHHALTARLLDSTHAHAQTVLRTNERAGERTNERTIERTNQRTNEPTNERLA